MYIQTDISMISVRYQHDIWSGITLKTSQSDPCHPAY